MRQDPETGAGALRVDEALERACVRVGGHALRLRVFARARERVRGGRREQRDDGKAQQGQTSADHRHNPLFRAYGVSCRARAKGPRYTGDIPVIRPWPGWPLGPPPLTGKGRWKFGWSQRRAALYPGRATCNESTRLMPQLQILR